MSVMIAIVATLVLVEMIATLTDARRARRGVRAMKSGEGD